MSDHIEAVDRELLGAPDLLMRLASPFSVTVSLLGMADALVLDVGRDSQRVRGLSP